jgi:O-succinylbenzoate synthase
MAVECIELIQIELPYVHFFETSFGREFNKTCVLVKAYSEGVCGYGEVVADKAPLYSYETVSTAWLMLKEVFIPQLLSSGSVEPQTFYEQAQTYKGHPMARAGLELALWDLTAKKAGVSLSRLYGAAKTEVASGVSVGIQDTPAQLLERIENFLSQGYSRIKIKIKPGWDVQILEEVRKKFPDILLQVDANAAYTLESLPLLQEMDRFQLQMLEQPFSGFDLWDHRALQQVIQTPICLDESAHSLQWVRQAQDMGSCRIINIKVGRVGGIIEALRIHDFCYDHSMPVWCGGMLETGIGRAHNVHLACLPGFSMANDISASARYFAQDLVDPEFSLTAEGTIPVPDGPGIGVMPLEDRIERAAVRREIFTAGN